VSHVTELAYRDRLERLAAGGPGIGYEPVISRPTHPANAGWTGLTGRLDVQLDAVCETHRLDPADSVAYLCGNPEMVATAERILAACGFAREAIVSEQYWPLA
jgi:ferredoxin-NADP reductase